MGSCDRNPWMAGSHDYLIVGAGSAGCVIANRLSARGLRVLLIEAGGPALPATEAVAPVVPAAPEPTPVERQPE